MFLNTAYIVKIEQLRIAQASYEGTYNPKIRMHSQKKDVYVMTALVEKDESVKLVVKEEQKRVW